MSPTYFVFTAAAVKSRVMRSAAFVAAGSTLVVRCFLRSRSRSPARPPWRMMRATLLSVDRLARLTQFSGGPGDAVGAVRVLVHLAYAGVEPGIGRLPGRPIGCGPTRQQKLARAMPGNAQPLHAEAALVFATNWKRFITSTSPPAKYFGDTGADETAPVPTPHFCRGGSASQRTVTLKTGETVVPLTMRRSFLPFSPSLTPSE
ncbi:hypothetical protein GA0115254_112685 [Streptomyces sp. Ncost-T10-10d]|nr:hypothetical protein GA0115254_112685 [Streptomyces sp. Ncost-T10-10d]